MSALKRNRKTDLQLILEDNWVKRSRVERRSDSDKRIAFSSKYFKRGGKERRQTDERRVHGERRDGWMRVGKWRSVAVFDQENK
jgi:hypothetical protein